MPADTTAPGRKKLYLLSIYQPDGPVPPPETLAKVMSEIDIMNRGAEGLRELGLRRRPARAELGDRR